MGIKMSSKYYNERLQDQDKLKTVYMYYVNLRDLSRQSLNDAIEHYYTHAGIRGISVQKSILRSQFLASHNNRIAYAKQKKCRIDIDDAVAAIKIHQELPELTESPDAFE
jgi:hypothetical protein